MFWLCAGHLLHCGSFGGASRCRRAGEEEEEEKEQECHRNAYKCDTYIYKYPAKSLLWLNVSLTVADWSWTRRAYNPSTVLLHADSSFKSHTFIISTLRVGLEQIGFVGCNGATYKGVKLTPLQRTGLSHSCYPLIHAESGAERNRTALQPVRGHQSHREPWGDPVLQLLTAECRIKETWAPLYRLLVLSMWARLTCRAE